ncbi:MAG: GntR family transcriptional regulator [Lentisphaeria bacterium]|nr:MAG: GntR family transcriptional regulator [Lentisphaeria bacterium]
MPASNIHEYIKLRQHFINLTLHADPESPLPSERTLAETFGVARKTVRRALEDMVAGNYLIKRPRRGYFVNPLSMREDERRQKIIGLLFRNGMHALYNREDACFMEAFFREIRRHDACVQLIMTSGTEMIYNDIVNSGLDGLVWLGVPPGHIAVFERIHREGVLPIVGFFRLRAAGVRKLHLHGPLQGGVSEDEVSAGSRLPVDPFCKMSRRGAQS